MPKYSNINLTTYQNDELDKTFKLLDRGLINKDFESQLVVQVATQTKLLTLILEKLNLIADQQ